VHYYLTQLAGQVENANSVTDTPENFTAEPFGAAHQNDDVIEDILPRGEVSILAGSSGCGKSTLLMQCLSAFQAGETSFLGHKIDLDTRWGYLANDHAWKLYEDTARRCRLRINDLPNVSVMDDDTIDLEKFRQSPLHLLEELLLRLADQGATAVVVDTLVSWFGGDIRNYNGPAYALLRLGRFCRKHQITILGTHHATKARTDFTFKRPQDRINGSGSLLGFSSTQLCLIPPDENGTASYQFHVIAHNAPAKMIALSRDEASAGGTFTPFNAAQENNGSLVGIEEELTELIYAAQGMSVTRGHMMASLGGRVSPSSLDRFLRKLQQEGAIQKTRHGEYKAPQALAEVLAA
jgi:hypothetical protein